MHRHARAARDVFLIVLPVCLLAATVGLAAADGNIAIDFRTVSPEIRGLAHGTNPYQLDGLADGGHFLWTVTAGWLLAPLAWLPYGWTLMVAFEAAGILAALRLMRVSDWRCYAVAMAWPATVNSVQTANLSVPLLLLIAAAWRDRRRAGVWLGVGVAGKLFVWPLLVWMAARRQWTQLAVSAAVCAVTAAATLAYLPPSAFLRFERAVNDTFAPDAISFPAALHDLGVPLGIGSAVTLVAVAPMIWFGRRDLGWLTVAALLVSPVVWLHYFVLVAVPLALWRAPLWVWMLPFGLAVAPGMSNGDPWQTRAALAVFAATVAAAATHRGSMRISASSPSRISHGTHTPTRTAIQSSTVT